MRRPAGTWRRLAAALQDRRARTSGEVAFVVLLPPVLFVAYAVCPINQAIGIDSWVYTGYITNFQDLIERYGLTYYAVRFGLILPGVGLTKLLGAKAGYVALAYVFYLTAGVPLYLAIRKAFGPAGACLGYLTFLSSVWIARTILGQYVASAAVAYLIGAIGLVLRDPAPRRATYVVVGALCGLAMHSQFFAAGFALLAVIPYSVVNRGAIRARVVSDTVSAVAGVAGVTCAGVLFYWATVGEWNIFRSTASLVALGNAPGIGARPTEPYWYLDRPWLLYPPFVLAGGAWLWMSGGPRRRAFAAALLYAVAGVAFFSLWDLYGVGWAVTGYFAMLAACLLPLACMIPAAIAGAARLSGRQHVLAGLLIAGAPLAWATFGPVPARIGRAAVLVAVPLALAAIGWAARSRPVALAACALFAVTSHVVFVTGGETAPRPSGEAPARRSPYAPVFDSFLNPTFAAVRAHEWQTYGLALQLISAMPKIADDGEPLRFWYPFQRLRDLRDLSQPKLSALQSTYLWAYSRLPGGARRGSPEIGREERAILNEGRPFHLALLATRREQLDEARAALARERIRFAPVLERTLCERRLCVLVDLLHVDATAGYWLSGGPDVRGRTLLAADARSLEKTLERNVYGRAGTAGVLAFDGDRLVFHPTSRRDHLATPFLSLDAHQGGPRLGVRVTSRMPDRPAGRCELAVQTRAFQTLARFSCRRARVAGGDARVVEVEVPSDAEALRVLLVSADGRRADLPLTVQLDVFSLPAR